MKNSTRTILGGVVLALMTAALAAVVPATPALLWVAVSAMLIAIAAMVLATLFVIRSARTGADGPQRFVFPVLAWQFLGLHAVLSVVVVGLDALGIWSAGWIVFGVGHFLILGMFSLLIFATAAGKDEIAEVQEVVREKVADWQLLLADVAAIRERIPTGNPQAVAALKAMEDAHNSLRYSDPISNPALASIESDLRSLVAELAAAVESGRIEAVPEVSSRLKTLLKERNIRLKALK